MLDHASRGFHLAGRAIAALDGVSLAVPVGGIVAIVGPSEIGRAHV